MRWPLIPSWLRRALDRRRLAARPSGVPNPGVRIIDGLIVPQYGCQADVVDHCNLSCRDCDHLSPLARKGWADPDRLYRDLALLAKVYRPHLFQLYGGEPLLHPDLLAVIRAVRSSGISERVMVCTNGLLLGRMPDAFWEAVDLLEVSCYPGHLPDPRQVQTYQDQARAFGVRLDLYRYPAFRRHFSYRPATDPALTARLYRACKKVQVWGCHSVRDGYIYRCPQGMAMPRLLGLPAQAATRDGLRLCDAPDLRDQLFAYLTAPTPLAACRHCLATAGLLRPHAQCARRDRPSAQDGPYESLVDWDELRLIEADLHINRPEHIREPLDAHRAP